jgi:hypothetical protein
MQWLFLDDSYEVSIYIQRFLPKNIVFSKCENRNFYSEKLTACLYNNISNFINQQIMNKLLNKYGLY